MVRIGGLVAIGAALLACGPGPDGTGDGGTGTDVGADAEGRRDADPPTPPAPPNIPWLDEGLPPIAQPMLTPCPAGWHQVVDEGATGEPAAVRCDPYGDEAGGGEPDVCPDGSAHFVGDAACTPVGAPCPAGDFPEGLPADVEVLHVLASAGLGGDGTQASPLPTIAEAMALASAGTIIAIGKGVYRGTVLVRGGVTLWGACAAETRLTASRPGPTTPGVITVAAADTHLVNLWVGPADVPGVVAMGADASVAFDGLVIDGVQDIGLLAVEGAQLRGSDLTVSGTRADASGLFGRGIMLQGGSEADLTRLVVSQNRQGGVVAVDAGTSLRLTDVVVRDTQAQVSDGTVGVGLDLRYGATATVARALLLRNRAAGASAFGVGTSLTAADVIIRDTREQESDLTEGMGLSVNEGATATVARALLSRNRTYGVYAAAEGTSLTLTDVVIEDTRGAASDGTNGGGLVVLLGATVEVSRARLSRNGSFGALIDGETTSLTLADVIIEDTQGQESDDTGGVGLGVQHGTAALARALFVRNRDVGVFATGETASLTASDIVIRDTQGHGASILGGRGLNVVGGVTVDVRRAFLSNNHVVSVFAAETGTTLRLSDAVVEDTQATHDGIIGAGLIALAGPTVEVTRARFSRNRWLAIHAHDEGTALTLSDLVVEDTQAQERDGTSGRAINAQEGATVNVTRARLSRNREFGVIASTMGTTVRLTDITVRETAPQPCGSTTCADHPFGVGLASAAGASLTASRFEVQDAVLCGVLVAENGQLDLSNGEVSGSQIGACLQVDGYSIARLTNRVRFLDNDTNLDTTHLPVPATASSIEGTE